MAGQLNQVQNQETWDRIQATAKNNAAKAFAVGSRRGLTHLEGGYYDAMQAKQRGGW